MPLYLYLLVQIKATTILFLPIGGFSESTNAVKIEA